jgi:protein O-mannosyl-transferase
MEETDADAIGVASRQERGPGNYSAAFLSSYGTYVLNTSQDYDQVERIWRGVLRGNPHNANTLGLYAWFLQYIRGDADEAEKYYQRALRADPNRVIELDAYALLLENVRKDYAGAEKLYQRALELDPDHANTLGDYAVFLELIRKDYDRAEEMYLHAVAVDRTHANNLANYAAFSQIVRKDYEKAQHLYERALEQNFWNTSALGNYAGLMLAMGGFVAGNSALNQVIERFSWGPTGTGLEAEVWFYAYAHWREDKRAEALKELKKVLTGGLRSPGWDLNPNVERARADGHPEIEWVQVLADVITKDEDMGKLDAWPEWQAA